MKRGVVTLGSLLLLVSGACTDDSIVGTEGTGSETGTTGDGDGDGTGDGDGDPATGDGDGDMTGDGDGDMTGDGDGDMTGDGDGDGDMTGDGDGDGDMTGDGDGDMTGDGDGDMMGVCGDGEVSGDEACDDGVNDGSYGGCAEDCMSLGPFCGDGELDEGEEVCDDGVNEGGYGGCEMGCQALGPSCGDGLLDIDNETCDDENLDAMDGCDDLCQVEAMFCCDGEPSVCEAVGMVGGLTEMLALDIPDAAYDGSLDSMACVEVDVELPPGICAPLELSAVAVDLGLEHTWVGDLTIKLVGPDDVLTTLLSRPGLDEEFDDGEDCCGDSSNLDDILTFVDGGETDAELMGDTLGNPGFVCADDMLCEYDPNPGAGMGNPFEDHLGGAIAGIWRLCVGDSGVNDFGVLDSVGLRLTTEPGDQPDP